MNKTILITGATSGIGLACARKFAANGDRLILTGRNERRLNDISKELKAQGTEVLTLCFDVRDRDKAKEAVAALPSEWQTIVVLVNNAGLALGLEPEYEGCFDDWETMIDTNIKGLLTMTRLIVPGMVERNSGHIINIDFVVVVVDYNILEIYYFDHIVEEEIVVDYMDYYIDLVDYIYLEEVVDYIEVVDIEEDIY